MAHQATTIIEEHIDKKVKRMYFAPVDKFLAFEEYVNPQGETIYLTIEHEVGYLATSDFRTFFPLRSRGTFDPDIFINEKGMVPPLYSPIEFLWKFDSYGLTEALAGLYLPSGVEEQDILVTAPIPSPTVLKGTDKPALFNSYLNELRRYVEVSTSGGAMYRNPLVDARETFLATVRKETAANNLELDGENLIRSLLRLEANIARGTVMTLRKEGQLFIYVPKFEIDQLHNGNVNVNSKTGVVLSLADGLGDQFLSFLTLGSFDSVVTTFLTYKRLKETRKPLYKAFIVTEIGGKEREIHAPNDDLNQQLKKIAKILSKYYESSVKGTPVHTLSMAFRPNLSIRDNVTAHRNNLHVIKFDIANFYKNVRWRYYQNYIKFLINPNRLKSLGEKEYSLIAELEEAFQDILIDPSCQGLYMGNPLSPVLTNLMMRKVILNVHNVISSINEKLPEERKIKFTIYADDLTFSSPTYDGTGYFTIKFLTNMVNKIFTDFKFSTLKLNPDKTHHMSRNRRMITGLRINHKDQVTIPRSKYALVRQVLHRLETTGDPTTLSMNMDTLASKLAFYNFIDGSGKIKRLLNRYKDTLETFGISGHNWDMQPDELIEFLNEEGRHD